MKECTEEPPAALRYYPDAIPGFPFEPTRDRFEIRRTRSFGEGVISLVAFQPGDVVFAFTGFFSSRVTQFSLQVRKNLHLHDPYFYGKILHSCSPNMHADVNRRLFKAIHPIAAGEYITMDYAQTEDLLFRTFPCSCGSPACRGIVAGRKQSASSEPVVPIRRLPATRSRKRKQPGA